VLVHGGNTEDQRVATVDVMLALGVPVLQQVKEVAAGQAVFAPTALLCPGLWRLLEVRRSVGLRNPGHSMVKLMNPVDGLSLRVASYTHPEYDASMRDTLQLLQANALLLRGTEGEPVTDFRRAPHMLAMLNGVIQDNAEPASNVIELMNLPNHLNAADTAQLIQSMLTGVTAIPLPLQLQVAKLSALAQRIHAP
jgi:anthranilate phosphoribosyltransferase